MSDRSDEGPQGEAVSTSSPFLTVKELREILTDTRLLEDDLVVTLTLGQTGNLPIARNGGSIGWIAVSPITGEKSHLYLPDDEEEDKESSRGDA